MKDFSQWIKLKEKLDGLTHRAPLVSNGDMWWASVGENMIACLHQARTIDHRRLSSKLGTLDASDFTRVKEGFHSLYK